MKKISTKALIIIFAALVLVCTAAIFLLQGQKPEKLTAEIYENGKLLRSIDLNAVTESYTIELSHNTVLVEHGRISMQSAECPDHLCVKQGAIKNGAYPIVCLPNKVEIRITDKAGIDAVTGR